MWSADGPAEEFSPRINYLLLSLLISGFSQLTVYVVQPKLTSVDVMTAMMGC